MIVVLLKFPKLDVFSKKHSEIGGRGFGIGKKYDPPRSSDDYDYA